MSYSNRIVICAVVFALTMAFCRAQADMPAEKYSFSRDRIHMPKGSVALVGIDRQNLSSLSLAGISGTNTIAGLEPIIGASASNKLTVSLAIEPPEGKEPLKTPRASWTFNVAFAWEKAGDEFPSVTSNDVGQTTLSPKWKYNGSFGLTYMADANYRQISVTNQEAETATVSSAFYFDEKRFPMKLEDIPTDVKGLTVKKIAYTTSGEYTNSLLLVIADSMDLMSKHVKVDDSKSKFKWDPTWFSPL